MEHCNNHAAIIKSLAPDFRPCTVSGFRAVRMIDAGADVTALEASPVDGKARVARENQLRHAASFTLA